MRNLFNFIIRNSHWLLAGLLIGFSFYLVFSSNSYQRSVFLTSANHVVGWSYKMTNQITSFFHLRKNNEQLLEQNARLENELYALRNQQNQHTVSDTAIIAEAFVRDTIELVQFNFIPAEVVNVSFAGPNNFITLNKGAAHGVKPDMGVISSGVVGVISTVSEHFSLVIPVINPKFRLSAKLKNSDNYGSVSWDGKSIRYAQLGELPRHEVFQRGDTVITSFSRIFPKNLLIGYVSDMGQSKDDNFHTFNIQLATDFHSLHDVLIIRDMFQEEQQALEETMQ